MENLKNKLEKLINENKIVVGVEQNRDEEIKQQLETCLNRQGYFSGCSIRVYYNTETKDFYVGSRW